MLVVAFRLLSANHMSQKDAVQFEIISDPLASAKAAGLRYVSDDKPGIQTRCGRGDSETGERTRGDEVEELSRSSSTYVDANHSTVVPSAYSFDSSKLNCTRNS